MTTESVVRDIYTIQIPLHRRCETLSPFCETCKNGVVHLSSLEVRKFTETGKLPNVCKTCTKEFLRICRIQLRNLNEKESSHACDMCGRSFIHAGNLKKHRALHELSKAGPSKDPQDSSTNLTNGQTEKIVKEVGDGEKNLSTYVGFETRTCICKECGKDFLNEYAFLKHCQFHSIKKMFACGLCNQLFEDLDRQKIHGLSHEEKSEYICNICPLHFVKMVELKNHCLSTHEKIFHQQAMELDSSKKQVFACNLCDKTFIQRGAYLRHCEQHANRAQYVCKICSKIFASERRLATHEILHKKTHVSSSPKGKMFTCKVCNKHFKLRKTFMKHRATHK